MNDLINKLYNDLCQFYECSNIKVSPYPHLKIVNNYVDRFDINIKTAQYDNITKTIIIYIENRHIKDIMRSISHELYHHHQNIINPQLFSKIEKDNINNSITMRVEMDAYMFGNIIFRKWILNSVNNITKRI